MIQEMTLDKLKKHQLKIQSKLKKLQQKHHLILLARILHQVIILSEEMTLEEVQVQAMIQEMTLDKLKKHQLKIQLKIQSKLKKLQQKHQLILLVRILHQVIILSEEMILEEVQVQEMIQEMTLAEE